MQGQLIRPDGTSIESASVNFTLQLLSTNDECLLLEETFTVNMTASAGIFNLALGNGFNTGAGGLADVEQGINNSLGNLTGLTCASGTTYDPSPGDTRRLRITFDEGSGPTTLAEDHILQSVPYAMYAGTLGGKTASEFIQVNTATSGVTQSNIETVFDGGANFTELLALLAGTSSQYSQIGASGAYSLPVFDNATPPTTPIAGDFWYNSDTSSIQYYDGSTTQSIGTGTVTNIATGSGLTGGPITTTGTISIATGGISNTHLATGIDASKVTVGTLPAGVVPAGTDSTKLPLAGGTMTGNITMGDFNIINPGDITNIDNISLDGTGQADFNDANLVELGFVTMMPERSIHLGNFTDVQEATYVATPLVAADAGKTWFNTDDSTLKFWDGTQVVDLQSEAGNKLPLAGGQMTGNIDLNSNLITNIKNLTFSGISGTDNIDLNSQYLLNTGHITISAQHVLGLGGYTSAQETTYEGTLGAGDVGSVWYNSDTDQLKMWTDNTSSVVIGAIGDQAGFAMAADSVPNCSASQKLEMSAGPTYTWGCVTENGDIEGVTAGIALSGGGTTATVTLNVNVDDTGVEVNGSDQLSLKDDGVTSAKIDDGTIVSGDIAADTITSGNIALDTIAAADIAPNAVAASELADDAVDTAAIIDDAVTTVKILDANVTNAKLASGIDAGKLTTGSLPTARIDAGTGNNQIVQLDGSARLPAVDGSQLTNLPTGAGDIESVTTNATTSGLTGGGTSGAIDLTVDVDATTLEISGTNKVQIKDDGVTSAKIDDGTIVTGDIAADTITSGNIAVDTIAAVDIAPNAVAASELADDAVDTAAIVDDAVTTVKILDANVTNAKLASGIDAGKLTTGSLPTARIDTGTGNNQIVQLDGSARLPAVDGSQLTNLPTGAGDIESVTTNATTSGLTGGGTSGAIDLTVDVDATTLEISGTNKVQVKDDGITNAKMANNSVDTLELVDDAVTTVKILDANVTNAKLASGIDAGKLTTGSLPTARIDTGTGNNQIVQLDGSARLPAVDGSQLTNLPTGAGDIESVTTNATTSGLTGGGTSGAIDLTVDVDATTLEISGTNKVQIKDDGVTSAKIDDGTIVTGDIAADTITSGNIALDTIAAADIAPNAVAASELADDAVDTAAIIDDAVTTAKILDANVTNAKLASGIDAGKLTTGSLPTARIDTGTGNNQIVQLDGSARLPAVDGSQLTNLPTGAGDIESVTTNATTSGLTGGGTSGAIDLTVDVDATTLEISGTNKVQIKDDGVTSAKIDDGTIVTGDIAADTITSGNIAVDTIAAVDIAPNAVAASELADDAVDTAAIVDDAVTTVKILDANVTNAKLASGIDAGKLTTGSLPTARIDTGTGNNQIVQLDGSARLPAVDGSQLTNLPTGAGDIESVTTNATTSGLTGGGTSGAIDLTVDVDATTLEISGTNKVQVKDDGITNAKMANNSVDTLELVDDAVTSAKIDDGAIATIDLADGSVTDVKIGTVSVDKIISGASKYFTYQPNNVACTNGQVLEWVTANSRWECGTPASGADDLGNHTATTNLDMATNSIIGGTASGDDLTLESTSHATKGNILLQPTGGQVGIGTGSPNAKLDLEGDDENIRVRVSNIDATTNKFPGYEVYHYDGSTSGGGPVLEFTRSGGTSSSTTAVQNLEALGTISFLGVHNTSNNRTNSAAIYAQASESFSASSTGTRLIFQTTANGTSSRSTGLVIDQNGNVGVGSSTAPSEKLVVDGRIMSEPKGTGAGDGGSIIFNELASNGGQFVGFRAPDAIGVADSVVYELPALDGGSGEVLSTDGSGVLSWTAVGGGDITQVTTNLTTSGLTGGGTSGAIDLTVDVDTTTLEISGTNKVQVKDDGITNAKMANNSVDTLELVDDAVTTVKILDANVTNAKLASGIDAGKLTTGSLPTARIDTGTGNNQIVQLDGSARLPAVDGSQLTNLPTGAGDIESVTTNATTSGLTGGGTSGAIDLTVDVDATTLEISGTNKVQVKDDGITNAKMANNSVDTLELVDDAVTTVKILDANVTNAKLASGIDAGKLTTGSLPTARIDAGTGNNQIVQLDGSARLPAVDGSQLTNLPTGAGDIESVTTNATTSGLTGGGTSGAIDLTVDVDATTLEISGTNKVQVKDDGITNAKMANNSVDTLELVDDAVTSAKIDDGAIATIDLADGSVTDVKIGTVSVDKIISGALKYFTYQPNNVACTNNQVLKWITANSRWECANDSSTDNLGDHTATANVQLNGNWLSNDGGNEGVFVTTDGQVGVGTSSPLHKFRVNETLSAATATDEESTFFETILNPSGNIAIGNNDRTGVRSDLYVPGGSSNSIDRAFGVYSIFNNNGTGSVNDGNGGSFGATNYGSGAVTNLTGSYSWANSNAGTVTNQRAINTWNNVDGATVTTMNGARITNVVASGAVTEMFGLYVINGITGGTVTNRYGVYIDDSAGAPSGNDYGLYSASDADSYFDGNLGVGDIAPGTKLDVTGRITSGPKGTSGGDGGSIIFEELIINGLNHVGFRAPDLLAANTVWELPAADGTSGQVLQTNGSGVLSWVTAGGGGASSLDGLSDAISDSADDNLMLGDSTGTAIAATGFTNTGVGHESLSALTTGDDNVALGFSALNSVATTSKNIGIGSYTYASGTGESNIAIGNNALNNNSASSHGSFNVVLGAEAAFSSEVGDIFSDSILIGSGSGQLGRGTNVVAIGAGAFIEGEGNSNILVGTYAGYRITGGNNVHIGESAAGDNSAGKTGTNNTSLGHNAHNLISTGSNNLALGSSAGLNITTGSNNITIGSGVSAASATASNQLNIGNAITGDLSTGDITIDNEIRLSDSDDSHYVGFASPASVASNLIWTLPTTDGTSGQTLQTNGSGVLSWTSGAGGATTIDELTDASSDSGANNITLGDSTGTSISSGVHNIGLGHESMSALTTGNSNIGIGVYALNHVVSGFQNIGIGEAAYFQGTGDQNVAVGAYTLFNNSASSHGSRNTAIGDGAAQSNTLGDIFLESTLVGHSAGAEAQGDNVVAIGRSAFHNGAGDFNVLVGSYAGFNVLGGNNVHIGTNSAGNGVAGKTGANNTSVGYSSHNILTTGSNNISLGYQAGDNLTTGSNNITIGYDIDAVSATANDQLNIANLLYGNLSTNRIGIGTSSPDESLHVSGNLKVEGSTTCILGNGSGATNCTSDIRLKDNIDNIESALEKILKLNGVSFTWNENASMPGRKDIGVIAQEIEAQFPTTVIEDKKTGYKMVDYAALVAPLIEATKEQQVIIENNKNYCKVNYSELKEDVNKLQNKSETNSRKIASVEKENDILKKQNEKLKQELESLKKKHNSMKSDLEKIKNHLNIK